MNSKQYVIFLLCLLLLSSIGSVYSGEREKNYSSYRIRIIHDQMIVSPPDPQAASDNLNAHDDHEPEEQPQQDSSNIPQEYHDDPEQGRTNSSVIVATERVPSTSNRAAPRSFLQSILIDAGIVTSTTFAGAGITLFVLDRIVERMVINQVLAQYGKTLSTISAQDAQLMRMAYRIDEIGLRTRMHQMVMQHGTRVFVARKRSWVVPAITHLYFDAEPTQVRIAELMVLIDLAQ